MERRHHYQTQARAPIGLASFKKGRVATSGGITEWVSQADLHLENDWTDARSVINYRPLQTGFFRNHLGPVNSTVARFFLNCPANSTSGLSDGLFPSGSLN